MTQLGNERANHFLECNAANQKELVKLEPTSTTEQRKLWIRAKYERKEFVPPINDNFDATKVLMDLVTNENTTETDIMQAVVVISYGADLNSPDINGKTPLIHATNADNWLLVAALILHGAEIFATDKQDWCALHYACAVNHYRTLQVLTRFGMKERGEAVKTVNGESPRDIAIRFCATECLLLLDEQLLMGKGTLERLLHFIEKTSTVTIADCLAITSPELIEADNQLFLEDTSSVETESTAPVLEDADVQVISSWKRGTELFSSDPKKDSKSSLSIFRRKDKPITQSKKKRSSKVPTTIRIRSKTGIKTATAPSPKGERSMSLVEEAEFSVINEVLSSLNEPERGTSEVPPLSSDDVNEYETSEDDSYDESAEPSESETTSPIVPLRSVTNNLKKRPTTHSLGLGDFAFPTST